MSQPRISHLRFFNKTLISLSHPENIQTMASNDGARLLVFGLTFRQYDNRHMQQILRAYGRMPSNPGLRAALFTGLFDLSKDLEEDEVQAITTWLHDGGVLDAFPARKPAPASSEAWPNDMDVAEGQAADTEGEEEWERYDPAAFGDGEMELAAPLDAEDANDEEMSVGDEDLTPPVADHENDLPPAYATEGSDDDLDQLDEADEAEDGPQAPGRAECDICCGDESDVSFAPKGITSNCKHYRDDNRRACFNCLQVQLATNIQGGDLTILKCPFCTELFSIAEIKKYASPESYDRYVYLLKTAGVLLANVPPLAMNAFFNSLTQMWSCAWLPTATQDKSTTKASPQR
jgi:hypothetical protein